MKNRVISLLLCVACLMMLAACGGNSTNIMKKIEEANTNEALLSRNSKIAYRSVYHYQDGSTETFCCYSDADRFVYEDEGYVLIAEDSDVYTCSGEKISHYLFVGDAYKEYAEEYIWLADYAYLGDIEKVLSQEKKNGVLTVVTEIVDEEFLREDEEYFQYDEGSFSKIKSVYEMDAKTNELITIKYYSILKDGTEVLTSESVRVSDPETYVPDAQLKKAVFEGDLRTLTVTVDAGTDAEKVYTQTVSKGNYIKLKLPESYDQTQYVDAGYTTEYDGKFLMESDLHVYVRSNSGK